MPALEELLIERRLSEFDIAASLLLVEGGNWTGEGLAFLPPFGDEYAIANEQMSGIVLSRKLNLHLNS